MTTEDLRGVLADVPPAHGERRRAERPGRLTFADIMREGLTLDEREYEQPSGEAAMVAEAAGDHASGNLFDAPRASCRRRHSTEELRAALGVAA